MTEIDPRIDLALIFERDDVHDAFAGHCCRSHFSAEDVRDCDYCRQLRTVIAQAIIEWRDGCELAERAK